MLAEQRILSCRDNTAIQYAHARCTPARLHSLRPWSMQSYPESRSVTKTSSVPEVKRRITAPLFPWHSVRFAPTGTTAKVRQTASWRTPARLSASPNWLALIDCSQIIPSREAFVFVARPFHHDSATPTTHHVVRRGSQYFAQHILCLVTSTTPCFSVAPRLLWTIPTVLLVQPVTAAWPTPTTLLSRIEIGEAFLLADYWYFSTCMLCHENEVFALSQTAENRTISERLCHTVLMSGSQSNAAAPESLRWQSCIGTMTS